MRLHYISPSALPSRTANSVHVLMQCDGLARNGVEVTLFAKRTLANELAFLTALKHSYGVELSESRVISYYSNSSRGDNLRIAGMALATLHRERWPDMILSRNLYASYVLGVLERRPLVFETHQLEYGVRKIMQRMIMTRPWVTTVAISKKLVACLEEHHGVSPATPLVLHDAAPEGIQPLPRAGRRSALIDIIPQSLGDWDAVCGYFGHLYKGRGIDNIESMAAMRPRVLFLVFGGNDTDVESRRAINTNKNLIFLGHIPYPLAQQAMRAVDILLMPYQESVSIGIKGHDTARWMSPMKMFEYLASGVPIISSDLPVLREVLRDGENGLLVPPRNIPAWLNALDKLLTDPEMAFALGNQGHEDYRRTYTWTRRAQSILSVAR